MSDNIIIKMSYNPYTNESEPIAFIMNASARRGYVLGYAHIGQHSEASIDYMEFDCLPIETAEDVIKAYELVQELKSIGYEMEGV